MAASTEYGLFKSLGKHFRRLSLLDKLGLIIALWEDSSYDALNDAQKNFLEKVHLNAQGYAGEQEFNEDCDRVLKFKF